MKTKSDNHVKTTIYFSKALHIKTKQYALWTETNLSQFVRIAVRDKIKELELTLKKEKK